MSRTVVPTAPVAVSCELTGPGRSRPEMTRGLGTWAEGHADEVLADRETCDTRVARATARCRSRRRGPAVITTGPT
ncbi:hypothetical protein [Streptomyces marincola]|uniref:Uncharacterized protein n=1 Tax=Streptomyces marincola TaxID=2878388 RepID=A0A1W7CU88_9ACTN|nr:hypothetical protein [Streptomyces marincola]ARQ68328.1 hypothetical protein CAG99_05235 [Streptomyces marincola]